MAYNILSTCQKAPEIISTLLCTSLDSSYLQKGNKLWYAFSQCRSATNFLTGFYSKESRQFTDYIKYKYTVGEKKDWTKRNIWSKTTLIASGFSGVEVNPPFCKMGTFFHRSLALSVPIYRNFQSNGGKWRSHKLWMKKII